MNLEIEQELSVVRETWTNKKIATLNTIDDFEGKNIDSTLKSNH